jgi:hypothetical protein
MSNWPVQQLNSYWFTSLSCWNNSLWTSLPVEPAGSVQEKRGEKTKLLSSILQGAIYPPADIKKINHSNIIYPWRLIMFHCLTKISIFSEENCMENRRILKILLAYYYFQMQYWTISNLADNFSLRTSLFCN